LKSSFGFKLSSSFWVIRKERERAKEDRKKLIPLE